MYSWLVFDALIGKCSSSAPFSVAFLENYNDQLLGDSRKGTL